MLKMTIKKKINPRKSNKMIIAVAAGLAVVLAVFFALTIGNGEGRGGSMAGILHYLKNTEGLVEIKALDAEKRVIIVFNSDSKNAANFEKVAHYAALRLAPHWPDCRVLLAKNSAAQVVYEVWVKGGAIANEGPLPAGSDQP